jgi:hypothetical protein
MAGRTAPAELRGPRPAGHTAPAALRPQRHAGHADPLPALLLVIMERDR